MAQVDSDIAQGFITEQKRPFKVLQHQWNRSIQTMACKSAQLPSNTPLVLSFNEFLLLASPGACGAILPPYFSIWPGSLGKTCPISEV
jgi:hypothetical protein